MHRYRKQVTIEAPRADVWTAVADIGAIARWAPTITKSHIMGEANGGLGARRFLRHKLMGGIEEKVVESDEQRLLKLSAAKGVPPPVRNFAGTYELQDSDSGRTVLSLTLEFDTTWGPLGRVMGPVMGLMLRRDQALGLAGFKHYVEHGEPVPTRANKLPTAAVTA